MISTVTSSVPDWKDHHQLESAAAAHRRTITKKPPDATNQLCAALANTTFTESFALDASPAPPPSQDTTKMKVVSIFKKLS